MKINNKELEPIIKTVEEDSNYTSNQLNALLGQITELRNIWQGIDSETFCNYAEEYITFLTIIPQIYNSLNKVMKTATINYKNIDKEYATNIKKAVAKHE